MNEEYGGGVQTIFLAEEIAEENSERNKQKKKRFSDFKSATLSGADFLPEVNYWAFSASTVVFPQIIAAMQFIKSSPALMIIGPLWNYLDALCSLVIGIWQILYPDNHRDMTTRLKGLGNVANSAQLTILTAVHFSLFGGPAFAAAFGIGFVLSLDDLQHALERFNNASYWEEDLNDKINYLEKQKFGLSKAEQEKIDEEIIGIQNQIDAGHKAAKPELHKECVEKIRDTLLWGAAFTGMLLLCVPPVHAAALAVISLASIGYILKMLIIKTGLSDKIYNKIGFFKGVDKLSPETERYSRKTEDSEPRDLSTSRN